MTIASIEDALARAGVTDAALTAAERDTMDTQGFAVLRGVLDGPRCAGLLETFERKYLPADQWPAPRESGTRHALLDHEPDVRGACLAPRLLAAVHHILRRRFYLATVQGRDPSPGGGYQHLHRDWVAPAGPAPQVMAIAFLEPFGAANGTTRVVPGHHLLAGGANAYQHFGEHHPEQVAVEGGAGDVLVLDGYLPHSGTRNQSGAPRRSLQMVFRTIEWHARHVETRDLAAELPQIRYLLGQDA